MTAERQKKSFLRAAANSDQQAVAMADEKARVEHQRAVNLIEANAQRIMDGECTRLRSELATAHMAMPTGKAGKIPPCPQCPPKQTQINDLAARLNMVSKQLADSQERRAQDDMARIALEESLRNERIAHQDKQAEIQKRIAYLEARCDEATALQEQTARERDEVRCATDL